MDAPVLKKPIPLQVINEQAAYSPFDLKNFIEGTGIRFSAETTSGQALPKGMICTGDGIFTGIPAKGTQGNYEISVTAENDEGTIQTTFVLTIKPSLATDSTEYLEKLKSQVWEALEHNLPMPELSELNDRPVTIMDVYYLLERWASITIWDAFNLEPPGEKKLLQLEGASPHYDVYDRGSCLVASPKDLYSHERTLVDSLQTAKAMAREVYKRGWTIEMAGFEKMERAVWVELQLMADKFGKRLEVLSFNPTFKEYRIYTEEAKEVVSAKMDRV